jgi:putative AlgH/UPF0301 family transcriptional regulator
MLILDHDSTGAIGLQINKPFSNEVSFDIVMQNVGLHTDRDQPLYNGGPEATNRIHVIHSMDWFSPTTIKLSDTIGVSNDMSILAAISENQGPENFRVVAGYTKWLPGHLEGELAGEAPWSINHIWTFMPPDAEILFGLDDIDQWHKIIAESGRLQIANWF